MTTIRTGIFNTFIFISSKYTRSVQLANHSFRTYELLKVSIIKANNCINFLNKLTKKMMFNLAAF